MQNVWTNDQDLVLEFYKFKSFWLCFELVQNQPYVALVDQLPLIPKRTKPLGLFLNANAKNLRVSKFHNLAEKGRVLELELSAGSDFCRLELQLIPRSVNVLIETNSKKISWQKPRALPVSQLSELELAKSAMAAPQDWSEQSAEWWDERFRRKVQTQSQIKKDPRPKALEKKRKALLDILDKNYGSEIETWRQLGELLKLGEEIPRHLLDHFQPLKSKVWNIENCFQKAKDLQRKELGSIERSQVVQQEIIDLGKELLEHPEPSGPKAKKESAGHRLMQKSESKGRKLVLQNGIEAVYGKSASDNLALLRKAQPWDYWLHLRDYPGAHAIITRPRGFEVSISEIEKVAQWLLQESFRGKKLQIGQKLEVAMAECRFVRPIKGDKLGRVTYNQSRIFSVASKGLTIRS